MQCTTLVRPSRRCNLTTAMVSFVVRKIDPSTAFSASDPGSVPESHQIESVLTKAFAEDHFSAVITGHNPHAPVTDTSHITSLWRSTVVAGLLGGEVYVAETKDTTKKIIGCAVWFGPGHSMYDTPEQQQHALGPLMASFDAKLQKWWGEMFLPKYESFVECALGAGVKHNSWHLQTLGIDPEYQRKGVATLLVNAIVEKAGTIGATMCVEAETELNIKIYSRMGFQLMPKGNGGKNDCCEIYTGVDGNTFDMWIMARNSK
ncbi:hypothetical protein K438DRAFT_340595 [Mycena galopus ATCC 62051]|nr:hypothetical protein K438DRAFT_340595 [Mycena galopus ATCC 62051]